MKLKIKPNLKTKKKGGYKNHNATNKRITRNKPFLKMNCNPTVKGKTISSQSCYTTDVIKQIKNAYNKQHTTSQQIYTEDPTEIWNILKDRLNCKKEDCWLNEIKDNTLKTQIDEYIFAPDYPPEWDSNPNEWLTNYDILDIFDQYQIAYPNFKLFGPSPIDFDTKLPEKNNVCVETEICKFSLENEITNKKTKIAFIFNLDKHNEPGSHWVSLFVDIDNQFIYYFDSVGQEIPPKSIY